MPDRHDECACGHEREEHGGEAGLGCTALVDPRHIDHEFCICPRWRRPSTGPEDPPVASTASLPKMRHP